MIGQELRALRNGADATLEKLRTTFGTPEEIEYVEQAGLGGTVTFF